MARRLDGLLDGLVTHGRDAPLFTAALTALLCLTRRLGATARLIIDWRYLKDYYCVVPANPGAYRRFPGDKSRTSLLSE